MRLNTFKAKSNLIEKSTDKSFVSIFCLTFFSFYFHAEAITEVSLATESSTKSKLSKSIAIVNSINTAPPQGNNTTNFSVAALSKNFGLHNPSTAFQPSTRGASNARFMSSITQPRSALSGLTSRFTAKESRMVLQKFSEAIEYSFSSHSGLLAELAKNTSSIYDLPANEYTEIRERILVLPSSLVLKGKKRIFCLVAQTETFRKIIDDQSSETVASNMNIFKDLPAEEKKVLKQELAHAKLTKRLPEHCSFEKL